MTYECLDTQAWESHVRIGMYSVPVNIAFLLGEVSTSLYVDTHCTTMLDSRFKPIRQLERTVSRTTGSIDNAS